jgi:hypothetical protein
MWPTPWEEGLTKFKNKHYCVKLTFSKWKISTTLLTNRHWKLCPALLKCIWYLGYILQLNVRIIQFGHSPLCDTQTNLKIRKIHATMRCFGHEGFGNKIKRTCTKNYIPFKNLIIRSLRVTILLSKVHRKTENYT